MGYPKRQADCHPDKPHMAKGLCKTCYSREWSRYHRYGGRSRRDATIPTCGHPERGTVTRGLCDRCYQKEVYSQNPDVARDRWMKRKYGIGVKQYNELLSKQGNVCKICLCAVEDNYTINRKLAIDHDHQTGIIRGILCGRCNKGIGLFRDNPDLIMSAMKYLVGPNDHIHVEFDPKPSETILKPVD